MRHIQKGSEPVALANHLRAATENWTPRYENLTAEALQEIRAAIRVSQFGLCAYCLDRIDDAAQIEHYLARHQDGIDEEDARRRGLDWQNLLGVCNGGEGEQEPHCDESRGNRRLTIDPRHSGHMARIRYRDDGTIASDDPTVRQDLEEALRLNVPRLKNRRRDALEGALAALAKRRPAGAWPASFLQRYLDEVQRPDLDGNLAPFCGIVEWNLRRRIARG